MTLTVANRRNVLAMLGAALLTPSAASAQGAAFGDLRVDVAPLRAAGNGVYADWLAQELPRLLEPAFAAHRARGAPTLTARIDSISLGAAQRVQAHNRFGFGGPSFGPDAIDSIEGVALVSAGGRVVATTPLLSTLHQDAGLLPFDLGEQRRRVDALAQSFAYWLPRQMGL